MVAAAARRARARPRHASRQSTRQSEQLGEIRRARCGSSPAGPPGARPPHSGISTSTLMRVPRAAPSGSRRHSKRRSETRQETVTRSPRARCRAAAPSGSRGSPRGTSCRRRARCLVSTVPMPAHHSGKRAGSYSSFHTSCGSALGRRRCHEKTACRAPSFVVWIARSSRQHALELALGLDQPHDRAARGRPARPSGCRRG